MAAAQRGKAKRGDVNSDSPTVRLELPSQPESLTLVRGALIGIGEALAFDAELLDDLKTAVSEACNNVVLHAYADEVGPLLVSVRVGNNRVEASVMDRGTGIRAVARDADRMGVGLAVISALAERAEFVSAPNEGTEVRMTFNGRVGRLHQDSAQDEPLTAEPPDPPTGIDGQVLVSLSPPALVVDVLGRLARGLAAGAHFTVDRFSDLYLLIDTLATHARVASSNGRIACGLSATDRRLELAIGPFTHGSSARLDEAGPGLAVADELSVEPTDESELLRVVVWDRRSR